MLVKKIPIFQGFPAPLYTVETICRMSKSELSEYQTRFFIDIETTGLSRYTASVYLIGAVRYGNLISGYSTSGWLKNAEEEDFCCPGIIFCSFWKDAGSCTDPVQWEPL